MNRKYFSGSVALIILFLILLTFSISEKTIFQDSSLHAASSDSVSVPPDRLTNASDLNKNKIAHSWAIIIGISKYKNAGQNGLANLIFADDDAKAFEHTIRNLGWSESHIQLLTNEVATQRNIMIALESWLSKAGPNDQIILFWAGHGFPDPEDQEKVYFACYDTDISIPATGYRMDKVRAALEERKSKNVIVFADTCHAGKIITRGERGISIVPQLNKMAREHSVPKGWVFMVGADTDRLAIEHTSWTNGAFTHSLIKGLNGEADGFQSTGAKDNIVTMGELKAYMHTAMPDETQKVLGVAKRPIITTSSGNPDIWNLSLQATQNVAVNVYNPEIEKLYWESIKDNKEAIPYELYLEKYPNGIFAELAKFNIQKYGINNSQPKQTSASVKDITEPSKPMQSNNDIPLKQILSDSELRSLITEFYKRAYSGQWSISSIVRIKIEDVNDRVKKVHAEYKYFPNGGRDGSNSAIFTIELIDGKYRVTNMGGQALF